MAKKSPMLSAPIPGQSLTAEPGSRPWEKPAKYTTVEETLKFYIEDLSQPRRWHVCWTRLKRVRLLG